MNWVIKAEQEAVLRGSAPNPVASSCLQGIQIPPALPEVLSGPFPAPLGSLPTTPCPKVAQSCGLPPLPSMDRLQPGGAGNCTGAIWGHQTHFSIKGNLVGTQGTSRAWGLRGMPGVTGLRKETRTEYWVLISHLLFSPAELCEFIKATEALASHYVAMPQSGSSLFCQVRQSLAIGFKDPYLPLV